MSAQPDQSFQKRRRRPRRTLASARVRANRRNAQKSTGPKTKAGKALVAQNALQHGLAVPLDRLQQNSAEQACELTAAIEELATQFLTAGQGAFAGGAGSDGAPKNPTRRAAASQAARQAAYAAASAHLDVLRVQRAKHTAWEALVREGLEPAPQSFGPVDVAAQRILAGAWTPDPDADELAMMEQLLAWMPRRYRRTGARPRDPLKRLAALGRYEQRARARRRKALAMLAELN